MTVRIVAAEGLKGHGVIELEGVDGHATTGVESRRRTKTPHAWHAGHAHTHSTRARRERRRRRRPCSAVPRGGEDASAGLYG